LGYPEKSHPGFLEQTVPGLKEKPCWIEGACRLEGRLGLAPGAAGGLVVAHPHSLYGGSMTNNVVEALVEAGAEAGLATLRFNFRGVGSSEGVCDEGRGCGEDLLAALGYLAGLGTERLVVAGYSFGAWVAGRTDLASQGAADQIWVAPPMAMLPFDPALASPAPSLILAGGRDDFCPAAELTALVQGFEPPPCLKRLEEADHFFWGREDWIREQVKLHLAA